ncbi:hypothetical protein E2320_003308 [Naja naja]|nr:hypothetical protein E2320_003308 [Naja naja]
METGSGDPPSPPPRPSASRSAFHALKRRALTPEAFEGTTNSKPGFPLATANDAAITMDPGEVPTGAPPPAPCNPTEVTLTTMIAELTLVANSAGKGAEPGETRCETVTMDAGDGFSADTMVPVVNSVTPVIAKATVNDGGVMPASVALPRDTVVKALPVAPASPTVIVVAPSPMTPPEKTSPTSPEGLMLHDFSTPQPPQDMGSQSSLGTTASKVPPASDTLSYLDSVSLMSGTLESLTGPGFLDDASSLGSDSEINGLAYRKTDKYGFLGGSQYSITLESTIPVDVARQRELKWLDMFSHWDKWLSRRFQKVKLRCRKGIPSSLRAKAWQLLSNSKELLDQNQGKFEQDLYRILKAYTIYRPEEGYCQAQAPVAAVLLMHMPAEQAFWCLVQICEKYLPGYYSAGLEAIQLDGEIFFALLRRASPIAYRHLKRYKIDPILYMTEWFMCIFSRTLPWCSVLRVWDMFFCEGVKIVFRVGLVLLRNALGSVDKLRSCQGMYETMEKLRNLPVQTMQEEYLVHEVINLPVTEALIERENTTQLKKWRETRGELQYKPSRRLHGSRAIHEECYRMNPPLTASASLLSLTGLKHRVALGSISGPSFSPAHSINTLAESPSPSRVPAAAQNQVVVSEGLHAALPSPTGNNTPLGGPKKTSSSKVEKRKEKEREKQEKIEKEKQKLQKEQEKKLQKEREKQEKEREGRKTKRQPKEAVFEEKRTQISPRRWKRWGNLRGVCAPGHLFLNNTKGWDSTPKDQDYGCR